MTRFSANLGFLFTDLPLPDAIRAAHAAGFDAVECHWPYEFPSVDVKAALDETGLVMLGLNTVRGEPGQNGLAAMPGREEDARRAIDQAITYAHAIATPRIHVMAGFAKGQVAHETFIENLRYACAQAEQHGIMILIEPLNRYDAPGYFLDSSDQAKAIIEEVGVPNLRMMFDCYHLQIMEGDITRRLEALLPLIGHIQIASVPDRAEPDGGELCYRHVLKTLDALSYDAPIGAEYRPADPNQPRFDWMGRIRS
ncbi:MAG: TIM barrel protein [Litoreibacter sp.]|nr:TIM barrel protein [Litoreibacter sp.]